MAIAVRPCSHLKRGLFPHALELDWSQGSLWPIEGGRNATSPSLGLKMEQGSAAATKALLHQPATANHRDTREGRLG